MGEQDPRLVELLVKIKGRTVESSNKPAFNIDNFERRYRELCVELSMRRRQLKEVRRELDAAKIKNQELQYSLESSKRSVAELGDNMKLALDSKRMLEKKLNEAFEVKMKVARQNEDLKSENSTLKQSLMKCDSEKCELLQSAEELKTKNVCNQLFRTEVDSQHTKLHVVLKKTREDMQKLAADYKDLHSKFEQLDAYSDALNNAEVYQAIISKLEKDKQEVEDLLICSKGKNYQFEELLRNSDIFHPNEGNTFFFKQVVSLKHWCTLNNNQTLQWKKNMMKFQEYVQTQDKITMNLMENLRRERECNCKLIASQAKHSKESMIESSKCGEKNLEHESN